MDEYTEVTDFANLYNKANSNITYEILEDATERTDLQLKYGIGTTATSLIIVECGDRMKAVTISDLYTYDYTTYEELDTTEQALTNAILDVNLEKNPAVYFVTNHAEYANEFMIAQEYLNNEANTVEDLDLLVTGCVPEDCDVLVITNPSEDYTEYERDLVVNYINAGGNILALIDPNYLGVDLTNFQTILDLYGVSVSDGIIYESSTSRMINGYTNIIIPDVSYYSEITEYIASDGAVALMNSGKIDFVSDEELESLGVTVENLITSTSTSYLTNVQTGSSEDASYEALGTIATKTMETEDGQSVTSKLVLFANSIFASDLTVALNGSSSNQTVMAIGFYNNKDLVINSVSYLSERTDNLTIRKDTGVITYTATAQEDLIIRVIITALPIAILITGIVVWQIRRRKK